MRTGGTIRGRLDNVGRLFKSPVIEVAVAKGIPVGGEDANPDGKLVIAVVDTAVMVRSQNTLIIKSTARCHSCSRSAMEFICNLEGRFLDSKQNNNAACDSSKQEVQSHDAKCRKAQKSTFQAFYFLAVG